MGYACPVCETPQADGRHLANHLAFTAMIHGDTHEAWLADHAPGWEDAGEDDLASRVVDEASEIEFPRSVEDTTDGSEESGAVDETSDHGHGHDHDHQHASEHRDRGGGRPGSRSMSDDPQARSHGSAGIDPGVGDSGDERDVAAVLAEARELTERMHDGTDREPDGGTSTHGTETDTSENGETDNDGDSNGTGVSVEREGKDEGRGETHSEGKHNDEPGGNEQ